MLTRFFAVLIVLTFICSYGYKKYKIIKLPKLCNSHNECVPLYQD